MMSTCLSSTIIILLKRHHQKGQLIGPVNLPTIVWQKFEKKRNGSKSRPTVHIIRAEFLTLAGELFQSVTLPDFVASLTNCSDRGFCKLQILRTVTGTKPLIHSLLYTSWAIILLQGGPSCLLSSFNVIYAKSWTRKNKNSLHKWSIAC